MNENHVSFHISKTQFETPFLISVSLNELMNQYEKLSSFHQIYTLKFSFFKKSYPVADLIFEIEFLLSDAAYLDDV